MFEPLFRARYHELRAALVRRLGHAGLATEAIHEAYLRLAAAGLQRIADPSAYAVTVAANLATDQGRRAQREQRLFAGDGDLERQADAAPLPERIVGARQELAALRAALAELAPRPRTALLLSRIEGWSHARIAAHLQVSERMVARYIAGGLHQLRQRLREEGADDV